MYEDENKDDRKTEEWVKTENEVPEHLISENVARACKGTKIYWMKSKYNNVEKITHYCLNIYAL